MCPLNQTDKKQQKYFQGIMGESGFGLIFPIAVVTHRYDFLPLRCHVLSNAAVSLVLKVNNDVSRLHPVDISIIQSVPHRH